LINDKLSEKTIYHQSHSGLPHSDAFLPLFWTPNAPVVAVAVAVAGSNQLTGVQSNWS